jgi:hypothetical protein
VFKKTIGRHEMLETSIESEEVCGLGGGIRCMFEVMMDI